MNPVLLHHHHPSPHYSQLAVQTKPWTPSDAPSQSKTQRSAIKPVRYLEDFWGGGVLQEQAQCSFSKDSYVISPNDSFRELSRYLEVNLSPVTKKLWHLVFFLFFNHFICGIVDVFFLPIIASWQWRFFLSGESTILWVWPWFSTWVVPHFLFSQKTQDLHIKGTQSTCLWTPSGLSQKCIARLP